MSVKEKSAGESNPVKIKKQFDGNTFLLIITVALFVIMYISGCILFGGKGFTHFQTFLNLLINNAVLLVIACGMTCVMLTGGIDISVGSFVALTCMVVAFGIENMGMSAPVMLVAVLVMGLLFGMVQGFLVSYLNIQPFIVTMAGMFFARGLTAVISVDMITIKNDLFRQWANAKLYLPFGGYYNKKGVYQQPYIFYSVLIALVIVAVIYIVLRYTKFGRSLYAIGGNEQSALLMGLNVRAVKLKAYVLSSFLCAIGGFLYCLNSGAGFVDQAKGLEMNAIASAVIGGTLLTGGVGNVIGSMFGVLIKGTIESFITFQGTLSSSWSKIAIAALLCFFIVLQSVFAAVKAKKK